MEAGRTIWIDDRFVPWEQATTHVLSHGLQYGTCVFEGIRTYESGGRTVVFRLRDHLARLVRSAAVYRMNVPYTVEKLETASVEALVRNKPGSDYLRPFVFRGFKDIGVLPEGAPIHVVLAALNIGAYLPTNPNGLRVKISSVTRIGWNSTPPESKAAGHYLNSVLAKYEAVDSGFDEAVMLNALGHVVEGSAQNIFVVRGDELITPPLEDGILPGLTRDTVIQLARHNDIEVKERPIVRSDLILADAAFLTGTASEMAPIGQVDGYRINPSNAILDRLREQFTALVAKPPAWVPASWFTKVPQTAAV